jgi:hypothetical protein
LWARLTNAGDTWAEASRAIAEDPQSLGELTHVVDRLLVHAEPCGAEAVGKALAPLLTLYGVQSKNPSEWKAFWGFYVDALGDLPAEALKAGVADYVADPKSEFFPKPGPLKAMCERHAIPIRMAASRARKALQIATSDSGFNLGKAAE